MTSGFERAPRHWRRIIFLPTRSSFPNTTLVMGRSNSLSGWYWDIANRYQATQECEERDYVPELVYLYAKTGQTKRALYLIIDRLADVSQAIAFAKEQDDADLWEDLLDYSMDKPRFIRGLLEEVGTAINPITLVRRIPEGLEVEGLREGLSRMIKEYEIQYSISE